jgi:hypothetical protein
MDLPSVNSLSVVLRKQVPSLFETCHECNAFQTHLDDIILYHKHIAIAVLWLETPLKEHEKMYEKYKYQADSIHEDKKKNGNLWKYHVNRLDLLMDIRKLLDSPEDLDIIERIAPSNINVYCPLFRENM